MNTSFIQNSYSYRYYNNKYFNKSDLHTFMIKCPNCKIKDIDKNKYRVCYECFSNPNIIIFGYGAIKLFGLNSTEIDESDLNSYEPGYSSNIKYKAYLVQDIEDLADKIFKDKKIDKRMSNYLKTKEMRLRLHQLNDFIENVMEKEYWYTVKTHHLYNEYIQTGEYFAPICSDLYNLYNATWNQINDKQVTLNGYKKKGKQRRN